MKANRPRSRRSSPRHRWLQGGLGCVVMMMLASCVGPPQPVAAPPPRMAPPPVAYAPPPPVARADWRDAPITPGDWHWAREGSESVARFGPPGTSLVALRCNMTSRSIVLDVADASQMADLPITITTSSQSRTLMSYPRPGWREAALDMRDPLLDAMAFSRGRFVVGAMTPLYLPSWPEVSRVIEDCRER